MILRINVTNLLQEWYFSIMKKVKDRFSNSVSITNRKARYNYELLEKYEAGIVLQGSEIKSIREGKASLQEAYCYFHKDEMFIKGMTISPYTESTYDNHNPTRDRKLLLHTRELDKIKSKSEEKGLTIIPSKLYIKKNGKAKLEVALAKGKKLFDKRESLKSKDQEKEISRLRI